MAYEITAAGRYENPFLLSSLPAFLRGSGAMVVEAGLFGCGYAALGSSISPPFEKMCPYRGIRAICAILTASSLFCIATGPTISIDGI